jgi:hypothetical protein
MRTTTQDTVFSAALAGTVATLAVAAALGMQARRQGKSAVQSINATSHWLEGPKAGRKRTLDLRHTGVGFLTNHAASILWAIPLQLLLSRKATASEVATKAALVSAVAALVDYGLVPKRLTPGWEHALGKRGVVTGFVALALGLFAGTIFSRRLLAVGNLPRTRKFDDLNGRPTAMKRATTPPLAEMGKTNAADLPSEDLVAIEEAPMEADADQGSELATVAAEYDHQPIGVLPRSAITARHDAGSDANETIDGLNDTEEMTRHNAEDVPAGSEEVEEKDTPAFDRGGMLPKV